MTLLIDYIGDIAFARDPECLAEVVRRTGSLLSGTRGSRPAAASGAKAR